MIGKKIDVEKLDLELMKEKTTEHIYINPANLNLFDLEDEEARIAIYEALAQAIKKEQEKRDTDSGQ